MADLSTCPPLTPASITEAHAKIQPYIHRTPLATCRTLNEIASSSNPAAFLSDNPPTSTTSSTNGHAPNGSISTPKFNLFFKLENHQKIGAFKARGAHHALLHLIEVLGLPELKRRGVITHSSGNHAQALALASNTFGIPSWIVMPTISTKSKIEGTKRFDCEVVFSGSTSVEREEVVNAIIKQKGCVLVPPYDHVDIVLGQGTTGLEMGEQFDEIVQGCGEGEEGRMMDAVIAPVGGGGLLGGLATWWQDTEGTKVFGAEPWFEGANDCERGLREGKRVESVSSLTIADGVRTPVGVVNWGVVSDRRKVEGVYSVSEEEIKMTMRLVLERMKEWVEPTGVLGLAVVLFNTRFREMVARRQREEGRQNWNVGVVFSGGNTTVKAVAALFGEKEETKTEEREEGKVGVNGERSAENVAG